MSTLPTNSPILRLDSYLLWCIIKINADIRSNHRALQTTVATSHVCHHWRKFMLSTPSIWTHLIDLGDPQWRTFEARCELLRRTGTALLSIKVPRLSSYTIDGAKTLMNVVVKNLQRTQALEVTIQSTYTDQWPLLYLPAPHLESFDRTFTDVSDLFNNIFFYIFDGTAPMLRNLRFSGHRSNFTPLPPWLHQLRSLDLSIKLTVFEMLGLLMSTQNLVNLRLSQTLADHTRSTLPLVSLPQLAHLDLNLFREFTQGAVFLDCVCIPPACSLNILASSVQRREIDKNTAFAPIIRAISSCARSHFAYHAPQKLKLIVTANHFLLETGTYSEPPTFKFHLELLQIFPMNTLNMLLSDFSLPGLSEVTSLSVRFNGVNGPVPAFTAFMASLPSINTITTEKFSLRQLRAYSAPKGADTAPWIGFPALQTLKLFPFIPSGYSHTSKFDDVPDPISKYLMARLARGRGISIVDFTAETRHVLPDMAFLRKAVGLKVRWRKHGAPVIQEYICGTGAPQKAQA